MTVTMKVDVENSHLYIAPIPKRTWTYLPLWIALLLSAPQVKNDPKLSTSLEDEFESYAYQLTAQPEREPKIIDLDAASFDLLTRQAKKNIVE